MELCDLNPYIRFCWIRKVGEDYSEPLLAYDFRLFYGLEGEFIIEAEGRIFNVTPNRFVVIPPATPYILRLHPDFSDRHLFCIFNFDMNCRRKDHKMSIRPQPVAAFKRELVISEDAPNEMAESTVFEGEHQTADMIREIAELFSKRPELYREEGGALLKQIILRGVRKLHKDSAKRSTEISAVLSFIREHYSEPITNELIARQFKYHPNHLNRLFKGEVGTSLHGYIIKYRLKMARELLVGTDLKIEEIARSSGFDSPSYFAKYFRKKYGMTPFEYRNR